MTTGMGINQMTASHSNLPTREWSSSSTITETMIWPSSGTKIMTKNNSEFKKHPRLPDMCDLLILSVYPTIHSMEDIHILLTVSLYVLRIRRASRCKLLCFSKTETYQPTCLIDCLMRFDPSAWLQICTNSTPSAETCKPFSPVALLNITLLV